MGTTLDERLDQLEARLAALERRADRAPVGAAPARPDLETTVGLTWLNRAGAAMLVVGLALGAGWANQRGYLSPVIRNGLLAVCSLAVLAAGARMLRGSDAWRRRFALGVAVVGAFGLYLVPFTTSRVDTLITPAQAVAVAVLLTLGLVAGGRRLRLPALSSFGLLGGLSIPLLGAAGASSVFGLALVAILYLIVASSDRAPSASDHVALVIAAAGNAWLAYAKLASPLAPALVGVTALAAAATLRGLRADRTAVQLLFTIAVISGGVAWALLAADWRGTGQRVAIASALVSYGLMLVAAGVGRSSRLCRLLGIGTLALALAKLMLHDLWHLPAGMRVAALFVLGAGLLTASFFYSRLAARPS